MPQGLMLTESYHEVADFQSGIRALDAAAVAVDAEHFAASVSTLVLDDVEVEIVRARPMLLIGAAAERRSGCLLVLGGGRDMRWNGQSVDAHDVAVLAPGSCLSAAFQAPWAGAFVSADARGSGGGVLPFRDGAASGRHGSVRIQRSDAQAHGRLATLLREAEEIPAAPDLLCGEEARRSLRASLLESLRRLVEPAERVGRRRAFARQRIVRLADEYLCASPARPVYTEELCVALGISASALHEAFHATFGVSPHRFLKLRRMGMARAMLLSRAGPWRSVKAAALSHGFWHQGQFAHDYRATFGESPSETLARALLSWPGSS